MRSRLDRGFLFVALLALPMAAYSALGLPDRLATGSLVFGDGIAYFAYLPSLVFDHDLRFGNDYTALSPKQPHRPWPLTSTGRERNPFSIGTALLWSPFYLLAHPLAVYLSDAGYPFPADGRSAVYQLSAIIASQVYILLGLLLVYRMLCRWFERPVAALTAAGLLYGTVLLWYGAVTGILSHGPSFFATALLLGLCQDLRFSPRSLALLGLSFGLCVLIRPEMALYLPFPVLAILRVCRDGQPFGLRRFAIGAAFLALGSLLVYSPQLICSKILYGSIRDSRLGGSFLHPGFAPILSVLYSSRHGLFSWTPLLIPSVLGLIAFSRKDRSFALTALLVFAGYVYTIAIAADWWGGFAFGARRICSALPLLAPGLAAAIDALVRRPRLSAALLLGGFATTNVLNMEVQRTGLLGTGSDPISFAKLAEGRIEVLQRLMGSPAAFPGSLALPWGFGVDLRRFDRLWGNQLYQDFRGSLDFQRPRHLRYLGLGWSEPAVLPGNRGVCFVLQPEATILIQLDSGGPVPVPPRSLTFVLAPLPVLGPPGTASPSPRSVQLSVNGRRLGARLLPQRFEFVALSWPLPEDLPWTDELNEVRLSFSAGSLRTAPSLISALKADPRSTEALGLTPADLEAFAHLPDLDRPLLAAVDQLDFHWPDIPTPPAAPITSAPPGAPQPAP